MSLITVDYGSITGGGGVTQYMLAIDTGGYNYFLYCPDGTVKTWAYTATGVQHNDDYISVESLGGAGNNTITVKKDCTYRFKNGSDATATANSNITNANFNTIPLVIWF